VWHLPRVLGGWSKKNKKRSGKQARRKTGDRVVKKKTQGGGKRGKESLKNSKKREGKGE